MTSQTPDAPTEHRLGFLDGLRGLAALWVLIGHFLGFLNLPVPILINATYAVDLFMVISGFLMFYHASFRHDLSKSFKNEAAKFYVRRFFRIAPAYYAVLAVSMLLGGWLLSFNERLPSILAIPSANFLDHGATNILAHGTFVFGVLPEYHYRTILPDWSIGLEMQFYLVFPFLFLAMIRWGTLRITVAVMIASALCWLAFAPYLQSFFLPSFLAMKINMFLSGMLICAAMVQGRGKFFAVYTAAAIVIAGIPLAHTFGMPSTCIRIFMVSAFVLLAVHRHPRLLPILGKFLSATDARLGQGIFRKMGDLSYGLYLSHILIVIPIAAMAVNLSGGNLTVPIIMTALTVSIALSYVAAYGIYRGLEFPGITLGQRIGHKLLT